MFTQDQILKLIEIGSANIKPDNYFNMNLHNKLIEAKMLINKYGTICTDFILHSSHKDFFKKEMHDEINISEGTLLMRVENISKVLLQYDIGVPLTESINNTLEILKDFRKEDLPPESQRILNEFEETENICLWGTNVYFCESIPSNIGLCLCMKNEIHDVEAKHVVLFPM